MTLSDARSDIIALVKDDATKLVIPTDFDLALKKALARYSQSRPKRVSQTIACGANGQILASAITGFDEGFVDRLQVEYPIATTSGKQVFLDRWEWEYQQSDAGTVIRFVDSIPPVSTNVRIVHRVKHVLPADDSDELTVPESDVEAVCNLAAAEALQMLAQVFTQTIDKFPQADFANFANKGADYSYRAKNYREFFEGHMRPVPMVA